MTELHLEMPVVKGRWYWELMVSDEYVHVKLKKGWFRRTICSVYSELVRHPGYLTQRVLDQVSEVAGPMVNRTTGADVVSAELRGLAGRRVKVTRVKG